MPRKIRQPKADEKRCYKCKRVMPAAEFRRDGATMRSCRQCAQKREELVEPMPHSMIYYNFPTSPREAARRAGDLRRWIIANEFRTPAEGEAFLARCDEKAAAARQQMDMERR